MVKIRLQRFGRKRSPFYKIVVADSRCPRDGRYIEVIGTYNPLKDKQKMNMNIDKCNQWLAKGAQPTDRIIKLLASNQ